MDKRTNGKMNYVIYVTSVRLALMLLNIEKNAE